MNPSKARAVVENTGLFSMVNLDGRNMLLTKKRLK
jgi:hypothetical protein